MFTDARQFLIRCISPTHAGVGQDIGSVDMPIQREVSTGIPKIEASSFKGSFRATFWDYERNKEDILASQYFGESNTDTDNGAGILGVTDLKLLFYPVKSDEGIYKLVTCPYLLNRFFEDEVLIKSLNMGKNKIPDFKIYSNTENLTEGKCFLFQKVGESYKRNTENSIITLDEYIFENISELNVDKEYFDLLSEILEGNFRKDIVIISDEDFIILEELNREIITRNKIDQNTGTVASGALFTEEYLPAESILYGLFLYSPLVKEIVGFSDILLKLGKKKIFQIGGNTNLGKGIVKMKILDKEQDSDVVGEEK